MNDSNENPRRYKWPWFALGAIVLFLLLAVVWMSYAVHREKQERNYSTPIPSGAK